MGALDSIDLSSTIDRETYRESLARYQLALHALGFQVYRQRRPVILIYEGWDAAGKGGNIKRVTERLDPRGYVVHSIAAPAGEDAVRHYLYRFWRQLPEIGQIGIFDRSWYGRVLVERVEGFAKPDEWGRAYQEINEFEQQLLEFDTLLFKFWIHISPKEQLTRFEARADDELRNWKLTEEDWRNRNKWDAYEAAIEEMVQKTGHPAAPWDVIPGNSKYFARIEVLKILVDRLSRALEYDPFAQETSRKKGKSKNGDKKRSRKKKN